MASVPELQKNTAIQSAGLGNALGQRPWYS